MQVKSLDVITSKFTARAAAAGQAYTQGVSNPKRPWAATTAASTANWSAGVQTAITNGAFAKGVNAAGDAKWQTNSAGKGAQRYPQGVQAAGPAYQAGFSKYVSVLSGLTLPPRMPKGDPGNLQRSAVVANALRAAKVGK